MSARKTERKREGRKIAPASEQDEDSALYVYCIGEADALAPLLKEKLPAPVEDDGQLELTEGGGLAAVASRVLLKDYNEEALHAHLTDAAWMALRAMRHERVVDYFARRASVVPLRFGIIYLDGARIVKMLEERSEELRAAIKHLDGREEWGVNVFCDSRALTEAIASISPRLKELSEEAAKASPGQAYLMRKKMDAMRKDEMRAVIKSTVERVEQELRANSVGSTRLRLLKDEAGGEHGELVGKLAFLVERVSFEEFRRAAEQQADEHAGGGFRLELTGPWPAYNFVASNQ
jgi:hypothetical protein